MIYPFDYLLDKPLAVSGQRAESFSEFMKYKLFGEGSLKNHNYFNKDEEIKSSENSICKTCHL